MSRRLLLACGVAAAVVLAAPVMGQIRAALRAAFPGQFVRIVGVSVALAVAALIGAALLRIRERRRPRYAAIAASLGIAVLYGLATATGQPQVDAVERVHFVEYGVITFLFYRVWSARGDLSSFLLPLLAGFLAGTLDEWLQWFVPNRVGEARDVLLNLVAICCGLLFSAGVEPPPAWRPAPSRASLRQVCRLGALVSVVFAAFVHTVHLGYDVADPEIGIFRSHSRRDELLALSADRAARWRSDPPLALRRFSREDQYMDEGLWHVQHRNDVWRERQYGKAWKENLILERYFAPVLDTPSYAARGSSRWTPEQRAEAAARGAADPMPFVSEAQPYPILTWKKPLLWGATLLWSLTLSAWTWPRPASSPASPSASGSPRCP